MSVQEKDANDRNSTQPEEPTGHSSLLQWAARHQEFLALLFLTILALIPRLYRISSVPEGLNADELFNAVDALSLGPGSWQIYFEGNYGREALFLYLMAIPLKLFGQEIWALRLPAAILGTGGVLLAYLTGRQSFNRKIGFIAGVGPMPVAAGVPQRASAGAACCSRPRPPARGNLRIPDAVALP